MQPKENTNYDKLNYPKNTLFSPFFQTNLI